MHVFIQISNEAGFKKYFSDYIDGVRMPNDKLILIHVPEDYNFTDASRNPALTYLISIVMNITKNFIDFLF